MYHSSRTDADDALIADLQARLGSVEEQLYRTFVRAQAAEQQLANLTWQRDNWQRAYHNHLWHSKGAHDAAITGAHEATIGCELVPSACSRSHQADDGEYVSFQEWRERKAERRNEDDF